MSVCLFTEADLQKGLVTNEVQLDPLRNRTGDVWHAFIPDLDDSLLYGTCNGQAVSFDFFVRNPLRV